MIIRHIDVEDAEKFAYLVQQVENESNFMLFEPGERNIKVEHQKKRIETLQHQDHSTIFVAEHDNQLVGYIMVNGGIAKRNSHSVYLVVGIAEEYRGKGIGSQLIKTLEQWAVQQKIHRLELTVITHNEAALGLYNKMGFQVEGTKRDSLLIDGQFVDEYYMGKLL